MWITPHFHLSEFKDYPKGWVEDRLFPVCEQLEVIRSCFGDRPISIHSCYRTPEKNEAIGGAVNSQHIVGNAVDFSIDGVLCVLAHDVVKWLMENKLIREGGLGYDDKHVHYDIRGVMSFWGKEG